MNTVLFVGTFPPPVTGQSDAFEFVYENYPGKKYKIDKSAFYTSFWKKTRKHICSILKLFYYLLFKRIDLVYATTFSTLFGSLPDFFLLFLNVFFKKKIVIHLHSANFREAIYSGPGIYSATLRRLFKQVDCGIVLTEGMKEQFLSVIPLDRIAVVPNYYNSDLDAIQYTAKNFSELRVGYLSNLIYSKGILFLIDAVTALNEAGNRVTLFIAGKAMGDEFMTESEIAEAFYQRIADKPYIKFLGLVSGQEKNRFYEEIEVLILPSFYKSEAQPLSIIDAYRAGCAVITTDFNYLKELVKVENGILVSPKSSSSIADAIKVYLNSVDLLRKTQLYNIHVAKSQYTHDLFLSSVFEKIK